MPQVLSGDLGFAIAHHWLVYLGVFAVSLAGTIPMVLGADRGSLDRGRWRCPCCWLATTQALLAFDHRDRWAVLAALTGFFAAFNYLEARLPAMLSVAAPAAERGAALGMFSTAQFLGAFAGGSLGGLLLGHFGLSGVFWGSAAIALSGPRRAAQGAGWPPPERVSIEARHFPATQRPPLP